jgi:hypothetical protein
MSVHLEAFEWTGEPKRIFIAGALNEAVQIFLRIQQELLFRGRRCLVLTDDLKSGQRLRIFQENWDFIIRISGLNLLFNIRLRLFKKKENNLIFLLLRELLSILEWAKARNSTQKKQKW